jgi:predicted SAM-dependent methyltransferase
MRETFDKTFGCYLSPDKNENLNIGCGWDIDQRFINTDKTMNYGADVVWDLEKPAPFPDESFKLVVASHVLEHVFGIMPLMDEIYRILKPNGKMVIFVPYWTSVTAWANPEHCRCFNEQTFQYFNRELQENKALQYDFGNKCNFKTEAVILQPHPEYAKDKKLMDRIQHEFNIVQEMCAVLRKD